MSTSESMTAMSLGEFLKSKADDYGVRGRNQRRKEWLDAVHRLFGRIKKWLKDADPEGLLDVIPYEVICVEPGLGTYDAPALRIRFGPSEVTIEPIWGERRNKKQGVSIPRDPSFPDDVPDSFQGRVDVSDRYRKFNLLRENKEDAERWWLHDEERGFSELDQPSFEQILKDLLS